MLSARATGKMGTVNLLGLPISSTEKESKYTFIFLVTPLLLWVSMSCFQRPQNNGVYRYQFGSVISLEKLLNGTSFLITISYCDRITWRGERGTFAVGPICGLSAEVGDT